ncbi:MAG: hypothetical protein J6B68_04040 [Lachnospiraceae bacterium]|nr:hypothetical protein [Lachnospiraceae bacterium]
MGVKGNVIIQDFEILTRANQFKKAVDVLKNERNMAIPLEMNVCFACELYLKYLVNYKKKNREAADSRDLISGHNLKVLYDELSDNIKQEIKNQMEEGFEKRLESVSLNFQEVRYEYEYEKVTFSPFFLLEFANILSDICNR